MGYQYHYRSQLLPSGKTTIEQGNKSRIAFITAGYNGIDLTLGFDSGVVGGLQLTYGNDEFKEFRYCDYGDTLDGSVSVTHSNAGGLPTSWVDISDDNNCSAEYSKLYRSCLAAKVTQLPTGGAFRSFKAFPSNPRRITLSICASSSFQLLMSDADIIPPFTQTGNRLFLFNSSQYLFRLCDLGRFIQSPVYLLCGSFLKVTATEVYALP